MSDKRAPRLQEVEALRVENERLERVRVEPAESTRPPERTIPRSQRIYEILIESIDGIVWEADAETFAFTYVSPQAERILGYPLARWTA